MRVSLRSGPRFEVRPDAAGELGNTDYGVAYEVFVLELYHDPVQSLPQSVECIVDLGVNVGFSAIYFLHKYRNSRIIGFEPHSGHFAQAVRNLTLDGTRDRVDLYQKAAGTDDQAVWLSDLGASSSVVRDRARGSLAVEMVDVFPILTGKRIGLLKMDIEGGEYEILGSDRLGALDICTIVLEWHTRGGGVADKEWCLDRLRHFGYSTEDAGSGPNVGMLWARR